MRFMILLYGTTIAVVILLITKTIMLAYNNPLGFGSDAPYVAFFVILTIIIWLAFLLEVFCFILLVYLLSEKALLDKHIFCCLKKK